MTEIHIPDSEFQAVRQVDVDATPPGQPVFTIGAPGPIAAVATCPLCGTVFEVTPMRDCFWPACGHYPEDVPALADGTMPWCCESCGLRHYMECRKSPDG